MSEETFPGKDDEKPRRPGSEHLRPIKKGEVRNPTGSNGWAKARARFLQFARGVDRGRGDGKTSRATHVLDELYNSALIPGLKGTADRKLFIEQLQGKAKAQMEISGALDLPPGSPERQTTGEIRDRLNGLLRALAELDKQEPPEATAAPDGPAEPR